MAPWWARRESLAREFLTWIVVWEGTEMSAGIIITLVIIIIIIMFS